MMVQTLPGIRNLISEFLKVCNVESYLVDKRAADIEALILAKTAELALEKYTQNQLVDLTKIDPSDLSSYISTATKEIFSSLIHVALSNATDSEVQALSHFIKQLNSSRV